DEEASQSASVTPPPPSRRVSPLDMDMDDEVSRSASITPPTLNQRAASRPGLQAARMAAPDEEDDYFPTDSGLSTVEHTDPTPAPRPDPDDDESTVGYQSPESGEELYAATRATPPRRRLPVALVAGAGALLLALGAAVVWSLRPMLVSPPPEVPTTGQPSTNGAPAPGAGNTGGTAQPIANGESKPAVAVGAGEPSSPDDGLALATADAGSDAPVPDAGNAIAAAAPDAGTPAPELVEVRFEAPARTVLRLDGKPLPVNKVLALPPGRIRVRYDCPGRRTPKGTKSYLVEPASEGPLVLQVPCKGRR
ncbi:serine/threonine protein kinase, partial [Pyxidicoccus fallax]|nr:serine/threonine protein kinase [Pyxidicoccus fallax]